MREAAIDETTAKPAFDRRKPARARRRAHCVAQVVRHMNANLNRKHTLDELADIAGCSIWHFDRVFHRATSLSPMNYLSASRIEAAKRLLVTSDTRIIDICYEVGYNSLGSFGKRFTKMVGLSPRQVRSAAASFDPHAFRALFRHASDRPDIDGGIEVTVTAPDRAGDDFLVFAGLFPANVPTLSPAVCGLREGIGAVGMPMPAPGRYSLFAIALPRFADAEDMILQDCTLRGAGGEVSVAPETDRLCLTLALHEPDLLGPPLLPILPLMLQRRMADRCGT